MGEQKNKNKYIEHSQIHKNIVVNHTSIKKKVTWKIFNRYSFYSRRANQLAVGVVLQRPLATILLNYAL